MKLEILPGGFGLIEKSERRFCVYFHRRNDTGNIFYVGTGNAKRPYAKKSRNQYWKNINEKHGITVEIYRDELSTHCANSLERIVIYILRKSGVILANLTDGGEGPLGMVHSLESRRKMGKPVYCSNGMFFHTSAEASDLLGKRASTLIGECCKGLKLSAHGYAWSYTEVPPHPDFTGMDAIKQHAGKSARKPIVSDMGEYFASASEAARIISSQGKKISCSAIRNAVRSGGRSAGRKWRDADGHQERNC